MVGEISNDSPFGLETLDGTGSLATRASVEWPTDAVHTHLLTANFSLACTGDHWPQTWEAFELHPSCPGTLILFMSFARAGSLLHVKILIQGHFSDAFRVALSHNPISFLSCHNEQLKESLQHFDLVTPVQIQ